MTRPTALECYWRARASLLTQDTRTAVENLRYAEKWCGETLGLGPFADPDVIFDGIQLALLLGKVREAAGFAERNGAGPGSSDDVRRIAANAVMVAADPRRMRWWSEEWLRPADWSLKEIAIGVSDLLIADSENYQRVAESHLDFLEAIGQTCLDRGIKLRPVPQAFLRLPAFGQTQPAISYHTRGIGRGTLHWKEGHLPGFFSIDARGCAGWSTAADDEYPVFSRRGTQPSRRAELFDRFSAQGLTKYNQASTPYAGTEGFILVPLQIDGDEVEALAFRPPLEFYRDVVRAARSAGYPVVLKAHPVGISERYRAFVNNAIRGDEGVVESNAPINELIAHSFAVFTVNSGVGFEALLHGKPVVVGGRCDYRWAAVAARDAKGVSTAFDRLQEEESDSLMDRIEGFVTRYYERYVFDIPRRHNLDRAVSMVEELSRFSKDRSCR